MAGCHALFACPLPHRALMDSAFVSAGNMTSHTVSSVTGGLFFRG